MNVGLRTEPVGNIRYEPNSAFLTNRVESACHFFELTVSCAVTEVQQEDTTETIYQRLTEALRQAKQDGRNSTMLDDGEGPRGIDPPEYDVDGKIIRVGA